MFFGKQFWQSLASYVIGGIITVIFIINYWSGKEIRITKSRRTDEYSFPYKKSVTGKEKSQWKLESFLENKTTFKVLMRSIINFYFIFEFFFLKKVVVHDV